MYIIVIRGIIELKIKTKDFFPKCLGQKLACPLYMAKYSPEFRSAKGIVSLGSHSNRANL